jgi:hypothetical protein
MIRRIDFDLESPTGWMVAYQCCGLDDVAAELHFTRTEIDPRAYSTVAHVVVEIQRRCRMLTIAVYTLLLEGLHDWTDYIQEREQHYGMGWWLNAACWVADSVRLDAARDGMLVPGAWLELRSCMLGQYLA